MAARASSGSAERRSPLRVLIADDEKGVRDTFLDWLKKSYPGCVVQEAASHDEVMEKGVGFKPDLVLLDVLMPGTKDHIDSAEALRKMKPPPAILVLTAAGAGGHAEGASLASLGDGRVGDAVVAKEEKDALRKPVPRKDFLEAVSRVLAKRTSGRGR